MDYQEFLKTKHIKFHSVGIEVEKSAINNMLFEFQKDLVRWALKKGRSAIFADTGLGKTFMQLEWARLTGGKVLIIAPLSVAKQTANEALKLGMHIFYVRSQSEIIGRASNIFVTNYEMIDKFDPDFFQAVVLDESSILKGLTGKTRKKLTDLFSETKYRLCCTATPAPNDISEIANHSEFLGIMSRADMLSLIHI